MNGVDRSRNDIIFFFIATLFFGVLTRKAFFRLRLKALALEYRFPEEYRVPDWGVCLSMLFKEF